MLMVLICVAVAVRRLGSLLSLADGSLKLRPRTVE